jgi:hypothetical protein
MHHFGFCALAVWDGKRSLLGENKPQKIENLCKIARYKLVYFGAVQFV